MEKIIKKLKWTKAKYKKPDHEYTVKNEELLEEYKQLYYYIKSNYYIHYFRNYPYKYCDIGEYTYWYMSEDFNVSKVINRVPTSTLRKGKDGNV